MRREGDGPCGRRAGAKRRGVRREKDEEEDGGAGDRQEPEDDGKPLKWFLS